MAAPASPPWRAFIGLGSNLGDRRASLRQAIRGFEAGGDLVGVSPLYETEPVGGPDGQGPYLNVVVELSTSDTPRVLLERCRAAETAAGRVRPVRWGPRTPVGAALRGAAAGRPGARPRDIGPAQKLWWRGRRCG